MTKLERLWDDFPVAPVRATDLVRAARAASAARRRRLVLRPVVMAGVAAAVVGAFVTGSLVTSPGGIDRDTGSFTADAGPGAGSGAGLGSGPGDPAGDLAPVSFVAGLRAPTGCEGLLASYRERGQELVSAQGWPASGWPAWGQPTLADLMDGPVLLSASARAFDSARLEGATSSQTGTNTQEAGIDEPDLVKTDGTHVIRMHGARLEVLAPTATGPDLTRVGDVTLPGIASAELLLAGDTAVVIGTTRPSNAELTSGQAGSTTVVSVSLARPSRPRVISTRHFSAGTVQARQSGSTVRLTLDAGLPALDFVRPRGRITAKKLRAAERTNQEIVAASTLADWLPTYDDGQGATPLVDCDAVALPQAAVALGTTVVVGFDAARPQTISSVAIATSTELTYQSRDRIYLAGSQTQRMAQLAACGTCDFSLPATTPVYAFALDGIGARHIASGVVRGTLKDRWSMDAVGDSLRLALASADQQATEILTLTVDGTRLVQQGRLRGLGKGEELKSIRWFDDLALAVTFRRTDPLYAVDLTDPASPTVLSELKTPGFSTYLHPLDSDRLLGIGSTGGARRAKASLFDVRDLGKVTESSVHLFAKGTDAAVGAETRAFTWLPDHQVALVPLDTDSGAIDLAMIAVGGSTMRASTTRVRSVVPDYPHYGAAQVRTIELADGRVAVITPDTARLLDLG